MYHFSSRSSFSAWLTVPVFTEDCTEKKRMHLNEEKRFQMRKKDLKNGSMRPHRRVPVA
jgi:hypothetical protein